jgi:hypothetical protein
MKIDSEVYSFVKHLLCALFEFTSTLLLIFCQ